MEEILSLKELLLKGDVSGALAIADELEEMSRKEIINNIRSYAIILLLHLIKQEVERRTTRSWEVSIRNAVLEIQDLNERQTKKGVYLQSDELKAVFQRSYIQAINRASLEIEGRYEPEDLLGLVDQNAIMDRALVLISMFEN
jgi:vacuolar-type H+-ATPase subunit F/Vma7